MKRNEVEHLRLDALINNIVKTHGQTKANELVAREFMRIVSKSITQDKYFEIKEEACKRVLSGQEERINIEIKEKDLK